MGFSLNLHHVPKADIKQRVDRAADILGLENLLDRKPRELSGGQRQRVALGRAIVREPQAFLMDEPLSNLDAKLRVQTRAEITSLQRRLGVTTIYVTHDQIEALTMGDRIAVMNAGILQQLDTPQNLYDKPKNQFVATFIGSPAMNIFPGTIVQSNGTMSIHAGEGFNIPVPSGSVDALMAHKDQQLNIGIRPEDIEVVDYAENVHENNTVQLPVRIVEPLGAEIMLHLDGPGEDPIVARVDSRVRLRPGDIAKLAVNTDHLHAFDPQTEEALV
jgi:multiple sugar transport system ATP-binding protein